MSYPRNPLQQLIPQRLNSFQRRLESCKWENRHDLEVTGGPVNSTPVGLDTARRQTFTSVQPGEYFAGPGNTWQQRWFRFDLPAAPDSAAGQRVLFWDSQGETTAYINDAPWAGLDIGHPYCVMPDEACTVWLDTGTYQTAIWARHPRGRGNVEEYGCRFDGAYLCSRNPMGWEVYWDFACLNELVQELLEESDWRGTGASGHNPPLEQAPLLLRKLLRRMDQACDIFETENLETFAAHLKAVLKSLPAAVWQGRADLCGHAHLDLVWLWPESVSRRKAVHSFATVMRLMDRYPEFRFTQSQPPLYDAAQELAPKLFQQIRDRIQEGRWEATGGFEVESDVNLPCGEALARALKYGQQRFSEMRADNTISEVVWIPDVFGYSNCLPQIMKLGGIKGFFTTKMTWSSITRFPHTTFRWRGSDGSEIITHLCPTGYNGQSRLKEVRSAMQGHRQSGIHDNLLLPTGYGDGAGGPTEEMCERARRWADLAGAPQTSWTSVEEFFDSLGHVRQELPAYEGELYLEYHRGTYTTQSQFKFYYRKAEEALQVREAVRVLNAMDALPRAEWLRLCFAQFHDAIPGSSIQLVYQQMNPELKNIAETQLEKAKKEVNEYRDESTASQLALFNPACIARTVITELTAEEYARLTPGTQALTQKVQGDKAESRFLLQTDLPALSSVSAEDVSLSPDCSSWQVTPKILDNGRVCAEFTEQGQLSTLTIDGVCLNLAHPAGFRLYPDNPAAFDAWDIDRYSLALGKVGAGNTPLTVTESGPLRAVLSGQAAIGSASELKVDYVLEAGSPYLQISVSVDWHEDHTLLKYHLPTSYRGRRARYGAPFGSIERPQYPGYPNEESQWEVPGSRWAAIGDDGGDDGLAIITEAKYGFSCRDGDLGLSLLRASTRPDPEADRGRHFIRFAVGKQCKSTDNRRISTALAADTFFMPVLTASSPARSGPFKLSALGSLAPAWVCPAESDKGFIIRLHETAGARGIAQLTLTASPRGVYRTDFLENKLEEIEPDQAMQYKIEYTPYQIVSIMVAYPN